MQRLIFPYRRAMIICGYKTAIYKQQWGYTHYGIDISSIQGVKQTDHTIRASGNGTVVWCRKDNASGGGNSLGYAIAIRYDDCLGRDGSVKSLVVRYMHSSLVYVAQGDRVVQDQPIAVEGMEGTTSYHVHVEMDTDLRYPQYTPQVASGHTGWYKGTDSTLNPSLWLWQDATHELEPYNFGVRDWISSCDTDLPFAPSSDQSAQIAALERRIAALEAENARMRETLESIRKLVSAS